MTFHDIRFQRTLNRDRTVVITFGFLQIKAAQRETDPVRRAGASPRCKITKGWRGVGVFLVGTSRIKFSAACHTPFGGDGVIRYVILHDDGSRKSCSPRFSIAYLVPTNLSHRDARQIRATPRLGRSSPPDRGTT